MASSMLSASVKIMDAVNYYKYRFLVDSFELYTSIIETYLSIFGYYFFRNCVVWRNYFVASIRILTIKNLSPYIIWHLNKPTSQQFAVDFSLCLAYILAMSKYTFRLVIYTLEFTHQPRKTNVYPFLKTYRYHIEDKKTNKNTLNSKYLT